MVVFPPGVVISVSVFVDDLLPQPTMPTENRVKSRAAQIMRFINNVLIENAPYDCQLPTRSKALNIYSLILPINKTALTLRLTQGTTTSMLSIQRVRESHRSECLNCSPCGYASWVALNYQTTTSFASRQFPNRARVILVNSSVDAFPHFSAMH